MKLAVVSVLLGAATIGLLATPAGRVLDHDWLRAAVETDRRTPALHSVMHLGTELGKPAPLLGVLFLPAAWGPEIARDTAALGFISLVGDQSATTGIKWLTNRHRPDGSRKRTNSSFPSGHASALCGLAWVTTHRHRRLGPWIWGVAVWVSVSRVFLERHFPSDVLAGALLGILFGALVLRFQDRLTRRAAPGAQVLPARGDLG